MRYTRHTLLKGFLAVAVTISIAATALSGQSEDLFEQGNRSYTTGNFVKAVQHYLDIAYQQGVSASLLYNLANSYSALGETGEAILTYEQALRINYHDRDIRTNLAGIRKQNGLYNEAQPLWQRLPYLLSPNQWMLVSGISMLFYSLCLLTRGIVSIFTYAVRKKDLYFHIIRYTSVVALLLVALSLPAAVYGFRNWDDAVVLVDSRLQISPFPEAASAGTIREGRIVRPVKRHNNYILVTDHSGRKGWLNQQHVGFIKELPGEVKETIQ